MKKTENTAKTRRIIEKPVKSSTTHQEEQTVPREDASIGGRRQVSKPAVSPTTGLHITCENLGIETPSAGLGAEHESADKLLDASYVLESTPEDSKEHAQDTVKIEVFEEDEPQRKKPFWKRSPKRIPKPVTAALFTAGTCVCALLFVLLGGVTAYAYFDDNKVSEEENRTLETAPNLDIETWFNTEFQTGTESFLSDHLFERSALISFAREFENLIELQVGVKVQRGANINAGTTNANTVVNSAVQQASDQKYIVLDDRVVLAYEHNQPTLDYFVSCTNVLMNSLPDTVHKYVIVAPSRIAFETSEVKAQSSDPAQDIQSVVSQFGESVTAINGYEAISPHASEDGLYYRTDHHWTMRAAYYVAAALCSAAGVSLGDLSTYTEAYGNDFLGYLYANYPSSTLEKNSDSVVYYYQGEIKDEVVEVSSTSGKTVSEEAKVIDPSRGGYYTFIGKEFASVVIQGNPASDRVLMVISDSYSQAISPWFAEAFNKVIVIDPRFFSGGHEGMMQLIKTEGVTDFAVLQSSLNLPYVTFSALIGGLGA